jgi:uncharacterized repeat protein (TIGR03803 family)
MQAVSAARFPLLAIALTLPLSHGFAADFTLLATLPGNASIGAIKGDLLYGTVAYATPEQFFSLTTKGSYTLLHSFNPAVDGSTPNGRLALDKFGNVFGTAAGGGANNDGTLWEYAASGVFSTPHVFGGAGDGVVPLQGPSLASDGSIFGTAAMGAPNNNGIVFSVAPNGTYKILYNFQSGSDGHCPFSGVVLGTGGIIDGTTVGAGYGGNPTGSVWQLGRKNRLTTLYVFQDGNDGEWPTQAPALDKSGNLYGTTSIQNGAAFAGAIWTISAAGQFSVLYDLNGATDGYGPNSPLMLNTDGNLYGTTMTGGADNFGTVFMITPAGGFSVIYSFTGGTDGAQPTGNLVHDSHGAIYGGTAYGTVFKIVP